ncbi:hypothetical protein M405DRAFT_812931 [Rhizopogon salebrosus TDB-379]|nr:hypothetical protein M405DRAFT_812931 [Rhizopogon salebrosus TDB-379]
MEVVTQNDWPHIPSGRVKVIDRNSEHHGKRGVVLTRSSMSFTDSTVYFRVQLSDANKTIIRVSSAQIIMLE